VWTLGSQFEREVSLVKINPTTRVVELERGVKPCVSCAGSGLVPSMVPCPTGGRGPRGGAGGCKVCGWRTWDHSHHNFDVLVTCSTCDGVNSDRFHDEDICAHIRYSEFRDLVRWEVVDGDAGDRLSETHQLLGVRGCLVTCTDYGRSWERPVEELLEDVSKPENMTQVTFIVRKDDMRLCDRIIIYRVANGYFVFPDWDKTTEVAG
jgi:hypothetical protein